MNAKSLGQSIRRGLVVGAMTGFLAGWGAFAVRDGGKATSASAAPATIATVPIATPALPPVPPAPSLAPIPTVSADNQSGATTLATPAPVPTLQPVPTLPPVSIQPRAVTRTS